MPDESLSVRGSYLIFLRAERWRLRVYILPASPLSVSLLEFCLSESLASGTLPTPTVRLPLTEHDRVMQRSRDGSIHNSR